MIKNIIEENTKVEVNKDKIDKLKQLFPNCFKSNGEFDISLLENELDKNIKISKEGYSLNFLGKNYAKLLSSLDTETVLVPDEENNKEEINRSSENIYISGDNIDALKHLLKSYSNKIKCIYIDPPYNTGSDGFVYNDNFNFDINKLVNDLDITEDEAKRIHDMTNKKSNSHSAWLTFMYPRLYLARQLLRDDGVIFISIDDNEQANLKLECDSIFGEENLVSSIIWKRKRGRDNSARWFSKSHEYLLCYSKKIDNFNTNYLSLDENTKNAYKNPDNDIRGVYRMLGCWARGTQGGVKYSFTSKNGNFFSERLWLMSKENLESLDKQDKLVFKGDNVYRKMFIYENKGKIPETLWEDVSNAANATDEIKKMFNSIVFDTPKPVPYIKRMLELSTSENDIILDFFSGSASTAQAVLELNREKNKNLKYILVQLQEECDKNSEAYNNGYKTIDEIGQERIRRAAKKIKEETNADIDYGFKHYIIKQLNNNTLDKLETFEPNYVVSDGGIVDDFGKETVLTTWMLEDGYGLTDIYEEIILDNYTVYKCDNTLYLLNSNITDLAIKKIIEKYETDKDFDCNRIVLFGYSFTLTEIQTLKDNIKQVKNVKGITVDIITRY